MPILLASLSSFAIQSVKKDVVSLNSDGQFLVLVVLVQLVSVELFVVLDWINFVGNFLPCCLRQFMAALVDADDDLSGLGFGLEDALQFLGDGGVDVAGVPDDDDEEVVHGAEQGKCLGVVFQAVAAGKINHQQAFMQLEKKGLVRVVSLTGLLLKPP